MKQRYLDVEHVIKDGGSNDNTLAICEDYKRKFYSSLENPRYAMKTMKIVSERDGSIYDAMNKGVEMASLRVFFFKYVKYAIKGFELIGTRIKWLKDNN